MSAQEQYTQASSSTPWPRPPAQFTLIAVLNPQLQDKVHEYTVYMSYVQLYMELIQVGGLGHTFVDIQGRHR